MAVRLIFFFDFDFPFPLDDGDGVSGSVSPTVGLGVVISCGASSITKPPKASKTTDGTLLGKSDDVVDGVSEG